MLDKNSLGGAVDGLTEDNSALRFALETASHDKDLLAKVIDRLTAERESLKHKQARCQASSLSLRTFIKYLNWKFNAYNTLLTITRWR